MTVIAWDGKTLAADRKATDGGLALTVSKVRRVRGNLVGISGEVAHAEELFAWLVAGAVPTDMPAAQRGGENWCSIIEVRPDASVWRYGLAPYPFRVYDKHCAIGSGRDFALAAMHLGCTAREAVSVACHFQTDCGNGIDTLTLEAA